MAGTVDIKGPWEPSLWDACSIDGSACPIEDTKSKKVGNRHAAILHLPAIDEDAVHNRNKGWQSEQREREGAHSTKCRRTESRLHCEKNTTKSSDSSLRNISLEDDFRNIVSCVPGSSRCTAYSDCSRSRSSHWAPWTTRWPLRFPDDLIHYRISRSLYCDLGICGNYPRSQLSCMFYGTLRISSIHKDEKAKQVVIPIKMILSARRSAEEASG